MRLITSVETLGLDCRVLRYGVIVGCQQHDFRAMTRTNTGSEAGRTADPRCTATLTIPPESGPLVLLDRRPFFLFDEVLILWSACLGVARVQLL
jgi:hypothetical protein